MAKNRLSFAGSQTLLASENEFNSRGNFNSAETVGDARRLLIRGLTVFIMLRKMSEGHKNFITTFQAYEVLSGPSGRFSAVGVFSTVNPRV